MNLPGKNRVFGDEQFTPIDAFSEVMRYWHLDLRESLHHRFGLIDLLSHGVESNDNRRWQNSEVQAAVPSAKTQALELAIDNQIGFPFPPRDVSKYGMPIQRKLVAVGLEPVGPERVE